MPKGHVGKEGVRKELLMNLIDWIHENGLSLNDFVHLSCDLIYVSNDDYVKEVLPDFGDRKIKAYCNELRRDVEELMKLREIQSPHIDLVVYLHLVKKTADDIKEVDA